MRVAVVVEKAEGGYSAYSPDVIGCVAAAYTMAETLTLFRQALKGHFQVMAEHGEPLPVPATEVGYVEVDTAQVSAPATASISMPT